MRQDALEGRTVLFATHYLEEAQDFAERTILHRAGRVLADGPTNQLRTMTGGHIVSATLPDDRPAEPALAALRTLPRVVSVQLRATGSAVTGPESDAAALMLLTGLGAAELEITAPTLESAFMALTEDTLMNPTYVRIELFRQSRDIMNVMFAVFMPVAMYVLFGNMFGCGGHDAGNGNVKFYVMVSMAAYGSAVATTAIAGTAATESMLGWGRQIALTPMKASGFVAAKITVALVIAAVSAAAVYLTGMLTGAQADAPWIWALSYGTSCWAPGSSPSMAWPSGWASSRRLQSALPAAAWCSLPSSATCSCR